MSYFGATTSLLTALHQIFDAIGAAIEERGQTYHRGTFYSDVALTIRTLLALRFEPLVESEANWDWWAGECEKRAAALGADAQFAMTLPPAAPTGDPLVYHSLIRSMDDLVGLMSGIERQESDDTDVSPTGPITPAECVKITERFAVYWLSKRCGTYDRGYVTPWPWVAQVSSELKMLRRSMGEPDRAGSAGTPSGPIPPISWPG